MYVFLFFFSDSIVNAQWILDDDLYTRLSTWLRSYTFDHFPAYEAAREKQAPGSGKWFFGHSNYMQWESSEERHRSLECVGIRVFSQPSDKHTLILGLQRVQVKLL